MVTAWWQVPHIGYYLYLLERVRDAVCNSLDIILLEVHVPSTGSQPAANTNAAQALVTW